MWSRAMLPPPPAPCPLPSQCSSSLKRPPWPLRAFHPHKGAFGMGSRAVAGAAAGQSVPRPSLTIIPSQQFLSGGSIRSVRSCLMARASTIGGTLPSEQTELVGAEHPAGGQEPGIWGIPALIFLWMLPSVLGLWGRVWVCPWVTGLGTG